MMAMWRRMKVTIATVWFVTRMIIAEWMVAAVGIAAADDAVVSNSPVTPAWWMSSLGLDVRFTETKRGHRRSVGYK